MRAGAAACCQMAGGTMILMTRAMFLLLFLMTALDNIRRCRRGGNGAWRTGVLQLLQHWKASAEKWNDASREHFEGWDIRCSCPGCGSCIGSKLRLGFCEVLCT